MSTSSSFTSSSSSNVAQDTSFSSSIINQFASSSTPLLSTVYHIYQAILAIQDNMAIVGKDIQSNSAAQNFLNNQLNSYQYATIPANTLYNSSGAPSTTIPSAYLQNLSAVNQSISSTRQGLQNQLNNLSNSSQINTGSLNTDVNILQQSLQVGQALIQSFSQIVSLISNI
ncbi:Uncharacterized protein CLAVI_000036 [Candidatus Clavichlamydia salmonicola]|uniref:DUF720 domain-containing protein n=1 Tax=Candidatus Clavichlamydia salmonicola TaxID=469812 RepID=UPI0018915693|nr:DUF720 domain-containing protein [Candidatus Clavichlamydia salmonicola]MBF5050434.1 Uncharacterized protein [Candidatus Clavichlamydia salmonicola]